MPPWTKALLLSLIVEAGEPTPRDPFLIISCLCGMEKILSGVVSCDNGGDVDA